MFHATVSGLPDLKSFHEFTYKMWSSAQDDRFAMLFLRINAGKKSLTASFLADFVQNIIRGKEYILSACQTEADAFLVLVDLERLPLNQLHDRLKADFTGFLHYYDYVIYIGVSFATSRLSSIQEWEAMAKTACEAACMHGASSKVSLMFYRETLNTQHQEHRILPLFDSLLSKIQAWSIVSHRCGGSGSNSGYEWTFAESRFLFTDSCKIWAGQPTGSYGDGKCFEVFTYLGYIWNDATACQY